jgi:hypothetical protein
MVYNKAIYESTKKYFKKIKEQNTDVYKRKLKRDNDRSKNWRKNNPEKFKIQQQNYYAKSLNDIESEAYRKRQIRVENNRLKIKENSIILINENGGKCSICGYDKSYCALEFHHLDKQKKECGIGEIKFNLDRAREEIKKCVLLCSNCHKALHHPDWDKIKND